MTLSELHAITNLLDDPDVSIYQQIEDKIVKVGYRMVPLLESKWKTTEDILVRTRIEQVIDKINFSHILEEFNVWNCSESADLLELMMIINRIQYPVVDCRPIQLEIEEQVKEIWLEFNENLTGFEKVNVINKMVFEIWKYRSLNDHDGDVFKYNFMSNLMELKCGNQFSISIYYLILAERLNMPIYPILLEDQLVLSYVDTHKAQDQIQIEDVMFYINPNEKGIVFDEFSINSWVKKHDLENRAQYYLPVSNKQLVTAFINRLIQGYEMDNEEKKVNFLSTLIF